MAPEPDQAYELTSLSLLSPGVPPQVSRRSLVLQGFRMLAIPEPSKFP